MDVQVRQRRLSAVLVEMRRHQRLRRQLGRGGVWPATRQQDSHNAGAGGQTEVRQEPVYL